MKKYKLKKDLPLAKAGTIVEADNKDKNLVRVYTESNNARSGKLICQIEKENISEWLEEIPEKPKSVFNLKFGDRYFTKDSYGTTIKRNWQNNYTENQLQKEGKIFLTKEECDKDYEKELAIQRIKKYCWENNINTEYRIGRTEICATRFGEVKLKSVENYFVPNPIGYFNEYMAKRILENFEKDLKIIFDIE